MNEKHLKILKQGLDIWNEWRITEPAVEPDLSGADLRNAQLFGRNLSNVNLNSATLSGGNLDKAVLTGANLTKTILISARLIDANLSSADLSGAILQNTNFSAANLSAANLSQANLSNANLNSANLKNANLSSANLSDTNFSYANLRGATFKQAITYRTIFAGLDLREVKELETVKHLGPSEISIKTIYRSEGKIPEIFLRGCDVPDAFIVQIPSLVTATQPIQFNSCFISYSGKDEEFARRLHSRMLEAGLRVWFAAEDMKGGEKLFKQIDSAIQMHDRLLLVLSANSMKSEWVMTEIRRARKAEVNEKRRKLFPIRLTDYDSLKEWECFDADYGMDIAAEVREYFIPDFSNWKNHDDFERAFARLLADLKAGV